MKPHTDPAPMLLTLAIWLCALPVMLLFVGPILGLKAAAVSAGASLLALAAICWSACTRPQGAQH